MRNEFIIRCTPFALRLCFPLHGATRGTKSFSHPNPSRDDDGSGEGHWHVTNRKYKCDKRADDKFMNGYFGSEWKIYHFRNGIYFCFLSFSMYFKLSTLFQFLFILSVPLIPPRLPVPVCCCSAEFECRSPRSGIGIIRAPSVRQPNANIRNENLFFHQSFLVFGEFVIFPSLRLYLRLNISFEFRFVRRQSLGHAN